MKILYIEDDLEIGKWVKEELESKEYEVYWLTSGLQIPEKYNDYDLTILDAGLKKRRMHP
ncbi:response regulator transcription factor [Bacillus canaveralius]|uniref:response regulator transcription factor n=1 Tax=Bacillus canaveralius TaxID=1403243 RepID=UPI00163A96ED|nr:response regulator transcription factor [Bacillus canaveralius]